MRHLVITIGCEYGAKGNAIGRKIAEDLNINFTIVILSMRSLKRSEFRKRSWKK